MQARADQALLTYDVTLLGLVTVVPTGDSNYGAQAKVKTYERPSRQGSKQSDSGTRIQPKEETHKLTQGRHQPTKNKNSGSAKSDRHVSRLVSSGELTFVLEERPVGAWSSAGALYVDHAPRVPQVVPGLSPDGFEAHAVYPPN